MNLDQWQAIGIVSGALIALITALGLLRRKVLQPMWRNMKLAARLLEQLTGDPEAGVPSLMEQLASLHQSDVTLTKKIDDHLEWHANPGGRPAKATPPQTNGRPGRRSP